MANLTINGKKYWSNNVKVTKTHIKLDNDTIPIKEGLSPKIKVLSCAALFADVMKSVHEHHSISDKFII